ncbi:Type I transmembrane sorting receptor [Tulasnella sp. 424]|nr:Type I transmembrane sorting receptor [Tulasnella sp. 424]
MILPTSAITTALLLAPLVASNPTPPQRQAHVVPIRQQKRGFNASPDTPFNAAAAQAERNKISNRYANLASKKRGLGSEGKREFKVEAIEPFDIQSLKKRASSGENSLQDQSDAVGTPAQQTVIDFDTGSADLLVPTENCSGCGTPLFNTAQSSTFQASSTPFQIQYGDGSQAAGTLASDTVAVAGQTVQNQVFAAITQESGDFSSGGIFAGLMGMGFPSLAESKATPFFFNLAQANALTSNLFSFFLARGDKTGSELCIGCTDSSKYTGNVNFYPLDASATQGVQVYWSIAASGITVNGQAATQGLSCVMDTGTTGVYVPTAFAQAIYSAIPGATPAPGQPDGTYAYPCGQAVPEIAFVFGGQSYAMDATDFNLGPLDQTGTLCMGAIMGIDQGVNFATVGDAFLKNWYSVYDAGGNRVGLAKSNQSSEYLSESAAPSPSDTPIHPAVSHAELRGLEGPPIHRVSEDVLLCIFHDVVHPPPSGQHLARLGLVCKHWREIVESASTLWTYITALDGLSHVRNALSHTGQAPLDIVYPRGARCKADAFLLLVKDRIQYWRTVDISVSDADVLSDLQTSKMPLLETLRILIPYYHPRNTSVIDIFGEPSVPSRLTELEIKCLCMTIPLWLANLTSLSLEAVGHVTMEDLLRVLQSSNNLKVLKLEQLFTLNPNKAVPHITHLPSLLSLELWLPVETIHYLLSGLRTNTLSSLRLTCDMVDSTPPRDNLLSNQITHFMPTIHELVSRAALVEFDFYSTGVYSLDLGDLNFNFEVQQIQNQYGFARDVFEWLAEHLGPNFRAMPARLEFDDVEPHIEHLELYGAFPKPRVVEVTLYAFDVPEVPPISVLQYLSSPRQSDPSVWPFPHLERINYYRRGLWNSYLVEMLKGRYGDEHIQHAKLQPPQPLKEIRIYAGSTSYPTGPDMKFLKEVQDLAVGTRIFWKDELLTFE